jgi:nicotinamidase-related amidase
MKKQITKGMLDNMVVLLIDMQSMFINNEQQRRIIPSQIAVLEFCKNNSIPLIVIEYANEGDTVDQLSKKIAELPPENVYKITKSYDNAFSDTGLNELLISIQAKTLFIMGINACACVWETAYHAFQEGYNIITSQDVIAGCGSCSLKNEKVWYQKNAHYPTSHNDMS